MMGAKTNPAGGAETSASILTLCASADLGSWNPRIQRGAARNQVAQDIGSMKSAAIIMVSGTKN